MKFNKWTLGLAAVGAVSLASAARADEGKMNALQTALSNTTISGYISASANYSLTPNEVGGNGSGGASPGNSPGLDTFNVPFQGQSKQDGFNLDVVKISISKPQDESPWASGYQIDLLFGPDAVGWNPSANARTTVSADYNGNTYYASGSTLSDFGIQQAYIALRTPIGNGIDWKFGVFNTVIGYESTDIGNNPNYTRSWGWGIEPTEHTGILATYKINDLLTISAGVANTLQAGINNRALNFGGGVNPGLVSDNYNKTFMGSVTFTSPSSWGWAAGSTMSAGVVYGWNGVGQDYNNGNPGATPGFYASGNQINYYGGLTLNTPIKALTVGAAFDYVQNYGGGQNYNPNYNYGYSQAGSVSVHQDVWVAGLYATVRATDKLSFSLRGEYQNNNTIQEWHNPAAGEITYDSSGFEVTGTVQYDLWANVISRVEVRYDKITDGISNMPGDARQAGLGIYANVVYKF